MSVANNHKLIGLLQFIAGTHFWAMFAFIWSLSGVERVEGYAFTTFQTPSNSGPISAEFDALHPRKAENVNNSRKYMQYSFYPFDKIVVTSSL